jgi:hypothetical protein
MELQGHGRSQMEFGKVGTCAQKNAGLERVQTGV